MIARLKGIIVDKKPSLLLLDVTGVGYEIETSLTTFCQLPPINHEVTLHIHMLVRDDAYKLFGFNALSERNLFRFLIKVNGVGPKAALAVLSTMSVDDFAASIHHQDIKALTAIVGIGKKTAERLIIEMRDRLQARHASSFHNASASAYHDQVRDAVDGLIALGYKANEASRVVAKIDSGNLTSEQLIRLSLQQVTQKKRV